MFCFYPFKTYIEWNVGLSSFMASHRSPHLHLEKRHKTVPYHSIFHTWNMEWYGEKLISVSSQGLKSKYKHKLGLYSLLVLTIGFKPTLSDTETSWSFFLCSISLNNHSKGGFEPSVQLDLEKRYYGGGTRSVYGEI